jgi:aerobic carbon-monoxide dehydrogenase large subunit
VVLAETPAIAQDALQLLDVELEPLQAIPSTDAALADEAPLLHTDATANPCAEWTLRLGDPDVAFARADVVVSERLECNAIPESRSKLAVWPPRWIPSLIRSGA